MIITLYFFDCNKNLKISINFNLCNVYSPSLTSGNPESEVAKERIPESREVLITTFQSTCAMKVAVPIQATKLCATVLIALVPAHSHQSLLVKYLIKRPTFLVKDMLYYPLLKFKIRKDDITMSKIPSKEKRAHDIAIALLPDMLKEEGIPLFISNFPGTKEVNTSKIMKYYNYIYEGVLPHLRD